MSLDEVGDSSMKSIEVLAAVDDVVESTSVSAGDASMPRPKAEGSRAAAYVVEASLTIVLGWVIDG